MSNLNCLILFFQVINEGDSSFAPESQEELEENPSPVVDENNIASAKKQGPHLHNWSGDWSFWVILLSLLYRHFNLKCKLSLSLQKFI